MRPLFQIAMGFVAGAASCAAVIALALFGIKVNLGGWIAVFLVAYFAIFGMLRKGWYLMMLSLAVGVSTVYLLHTIVLFLA